MDFGKLKDLVKKLGGLLIFDGDEPSLVILSYDKFKKLDTGGEEIPVSHRNGVNAEETALFNGGIDESVVANGIEADEVTVERLNQEILVLKEEIRQKEEAELLENEQPMEAIADPVDLD